MLNSGHVQYILLTGLIELFETRQIGVPQTLIHLSFWVHFELNVKDDIEFIKFTLRAKFEFSWYIW